MTILRTEISDLIPGDVVEVTFHRHPNPEVTVRGTLEKSAGAWGGDRGLNIKGVTVDDKNIVVRRDDGSPSNFAATRSLVVISRAPRPKPPVYLNSDRTEYAVGDIVTYPFSLDYSGFSGPYVCQSVTHDGRPIWHSVKYGRADTGPNFNEKSLTLLVDGTTKQAVS